MIQFQGHRAEPDKKVYPKKTKSYYEKNPKVDIKEVALKLGTFKALDIIRECLKSEQTVLVELRKLEKQGIIEKIPVGNHDKQIYKIKS